MIKIVHTSDLHIGKRVNGFSMIEDQKYILNEILRIIREERPSALIIAGDVYDKSVPTAEAVGLFDSFVEELALENIKLYMISGNHDSAERLSFANKLLDRTGVHVSPVYDGKIKSNCLEDRVYVHLLPFIKPANVRRFFPELNLESYTDAVSAVINTIDIDKSKINILVTHQFVTGGTTSESEEISVGGADNVDLIVFDKFDYVALGHLHAPQKVGRETIRYSGTPLKYSFSESTHKKSLTIINIEEANDIEISTIPLIPKRDLREIRGSYMEITKREYYEGTRTDDYLHITLTDEEDIFDCLSKLRVIYPNLMKLDYDNSRTQKGIIIDGEREVEEKKPLELFESFYEMQNNKPLSPEQGKVIRDLIEEIWEGSNETN